MPVTKMIRYLCSDLVRITSLDGPQRSTQFANLEEIGTDFAEVLTECAFPSQAKLRIAREGYQMDGIVESCTLRTPLGYFVRVKLAPASVWSKRRFTPKHMLVVPGQAAAKVSTLSVASGY